MPHTKQAKKRVRTDEVRRLRNRVKSQSMRTHIKRVMAAVEAGDTELAQKELVEAQKRIDKCAKTNIVHPNKAARMKSNLARQVGKLSA